MDGSSSSSTPTPPMGRSGRGSRVSVVERKGRRVVEEESLEQQLSREWNRQRPVRWPVTDRRTTMLPVAGLNADLMCLVCRGIIRNCTTVMVCYQLSHICLFIISVAWRMHMLPDREPHLLNCMMCPSV
jgi:hypothetical protein